MSPNVFVGREKRVEGEREREREREKKFSKVSKFKSNPKQPNTLPRPNSYSPYFLGAAETPSHPSPSSAEKRIERTNKIQSFPTKKTPFPRSYFPICTNHPSWQSSRLAWNFHCPPTSILNTSPFSDKGKRLEECSSTSDETKSESSSGVDETGWLGTRLGTIR